MVRSVELLVEQLLTFIYAQLEHKYMHLLNYFLTLHCSGFSLLPQCLGALCWSMCNLFLIVSRNANLKCCGIVQNLHKIS